MPQAASVEIMVVDDQRATRTLVRETLSQIGCARVCECGDGNEALQSLRAKPVHLVVSDLNMPVMDGLALLRAVRAEPGLANTAFIMLTSNGDAEQVKQAIALGVNNYLVKPFTIGTLRRKIESVFGPLT